MYNTETILKEKVYEYYKLLEKIEQIEQICEEPADTLAVAELQNRIQKILCK